MPNRMVDFDKVRAQLQWLRGEDGVVKPPEAERVMAELLQPLLSAEGYEVAEGRTPQGVDWIAHRSATSTDAATAIAIEYKHYTSGRPVEIRAVRAVLSAIKHRPVDRVLLIARHGFTSGAMDIAEHSAPIALELLTLEDLRGWIDRAEAGQSEASGKVQLLVRTMSHALAMLVAHSASALFEMEWRDLERMIARVLEGIGFRVILTSPSKDGGKDVIAECEVRDEARTYIVELKHWRSGKRVGSTAVSDFVKVVASEKRNGGIFLSTSGFAADAFSSLTEVARQRIRFGGRNKIVSLARTYERTSMGLWSPPAHLPEVLFESTE